jgi:hypothetical protein
VLPVNDLALPLLAYYLYNHWLLKYVLYPYFQKVSHESILILSISFGNEKKYSFSQERKKGTT